MPHKTANETQEMFNLRLIMVKTEESGDRIKEKIEAEMKPAKVDHYLDPRKEKRRNG